MRTPIDPVRLTRRRVEKGLSQYALAQAIGASRQLVSAVSLGKANFSPENLAKVAEVLDCEIADLLPNTEARARVQQLVGLASLGTLSIGPGDLGKVTEFLGCEFGELPTDDLATVAEVLGCDVADLLPQGDAEAETTRKSA